MQIYKFNISTFQREDSSKSNETHSSSKSEFDDDSYSDALSINDRNVNENEVRFDDFEENKVRLDDFEEDQARPDDFGTNEERIDDFEEDVDEPSPFSPWYYIRCAISAAIGH